MLKLVMSIAQSVLNRFLQKLVHCDRRKKGYKLITKIPAGFDGLPVQFTNVDIQNLLEKPDLVQVEPFQLEEVCDLPK